MIFLCKTKSQTNVGAFFELASLENETPPPLELFLSITFAFDYGIHVHCTIQTTSKSNIKKLITFDDI